MTDQANVQAPLEAAESQDGAQPDLAALQAELGKARDDMLRALAEAENTRRRADRQVQDARAYAIDRFASDLLPVADTLTRALLAAPRDGADETLRTLIAGLELTERSMLDAFSRHGLKRVGAKGEAFDPKIHQAVAHAPADEPANTVIEVMQPGYVLGDRTLRAAIVAVSAGRGESQGIDIKV